MNIKNLALEGLVDSAGQLRLGGASPALSAANLLSPGHQQPSGPPAFTNNFGVIIGNKHQVGNARLENASAREANTHSLVIDVKANASNQDDKQLPLEEHKKNRKVPIVKYFLPHIQLRYKNISPTAKNIHSSIIKTNEYRNKYPQYFIESIEPHDRNQILYDS